MRLAGTTLDNLWDDSEETKHGLQVAEKLAWKTRVQLCDEIIKFFEVVYAMLFRYDPLGCVRRCDLNQVSGSVVSSNKEFMSGFPRKDDVTDRKGPGGSFASRGRSTIET